VAAPAQPDVRPQLRLGLPTLRVSTEALLGAATGLVLAWFIVPPLVVLLLTSVQATRAGRIVGYTLDNYRQLTSLGETGSVLLNTVVFGGGSAALAIVLGGAAAWLVERTTAPGKTAVYVTAFVSLATPGVVKVVGWILLLGPEQGLLNVLLRQAGLPGFNLFSMGGMILVEGLLWTPVVFLLLAASFRGMDPGLEEAAHMSGAGLAQTVRRVTLRLALPTLLSVLLLTVVRALEAFEIPALVGIPARVEVLTTLVYQRVRSGFVPQYGEASAYAVLLTLLVIGLLIPYARLTSQTNRFATVTGKGYRPRRHDLGRWQPAAGALLLGLPVVVLLPIGVLVWASLLPFYQAPSAAALTSVTSANYQRAIADPGVVSSLLNTLLIGLVSASVVTVLALLVAWLVFRGRLRARWLLEHLGNLPLVLPGIVLGIAVLRTYLNLPIPIYGTVWILVVAYVARYVPFGIRFGETGLLQIHFELEESARMSGAPLLTVLRRIVVPLMAPALASGWIYVFLLSVKELSVAMLLYGPQSRVVSVAMFELWGNGQVTELAAFCVVITAVFVAVGLGLYRLSGRYGPHVG
jgi:iron(III) transport system permease protein